MIIFTTTKSNFLRSGRGADVGIQDVVLKEYTDKTGRRVADSEYKSWKESLGEMQNLLYDDRIPDDAGILIEYMIPQSAFRVDFIITGKDNEDKDNAVIIELKRWSSVEVTRKDAVVRTYLNGSMREHSHPSYQAWSYAAFLHSFNEEVYNGNIALKPCAYLHNYPSADDKIDNVHYKSFTDLAPVFLKPDKENLLNFIQKYICKGDKGSVMYRVENGKIKPSKELADCLASMLEGNKEFILIEDQKVVYETAIEEAKQANKSHKRVMIVNGGPGTGKSVVAINLLVAFNKERKLAKYVTKNAAPRGVYKEKLTGKIKGSDITFLFNGSGGFCDTPSNLYKALVVDEAHRLNQFSGLYSNLGENQVKEIINAAEFSVFFLDEDQQVTFKDIGSREEIVRWAEYYRAGLIETALESQFRCNGSDSYLAWLDNVLQIRETANFNLAKEDYFFNIVDSPKELEEIIYELNDKGDKARMVAGYCWDWKSKKNPEVADIVFSEYDFAHQWNLTSYGSTWILNPDSITEIGCIHTCQGLEIENIGVIVGDDLVVRNGEVIPNVSARSKNDNSVKGYKKMLKTDPVGTAKRADRIIKNTYKTLMTRGSKSCHVYFTDEETREYFKARLKN